MIQKIKTWFKNQRREQTLKIIKKAKQKYLDYESPFMCNCFCMAKYSFCCYNDIVREIPEFKPSTFGLIRDDISGSWWSSNDRVSRIKAFDKLIEIYSK